MTLKPRIDAARVLVDKACSEHPRTFDRNQAVSTLTAQLLDRAPGAWRAIAERIADADGLRAATYDGPGVRSADASTHPERCHGALGPLMADQRTLIGSLAWLTIAAHHCLSGHAEAPQCARDALDAIRRGLAVVDRYSAPTDRWEPADRCVGSQGAEWDADGRSLECQSIPARNVRADGSGGSVKYDGLCVACYHRRRRWQLANPVHGDAA